MSSRLASGMEAFADAPMVNLKLDAVGFLRWTNKLVGEDVAVSSRFLGWRELLLAEGEQWLRACAVDGDWHAMESLGLRLINGEGLQKNRDEGFAWLRRVAELGNPVAMARLGECLLDGEQSAESRAEAEQWLLRAIEQGNTHSAITLGTSLIMGAGLPADPTRGKELLVKAACGGSQLAHIKLGAYLLSGRGIAQNKEEGLLWLRRVGITHPAKMSVLNYYVYMKSLAASTRWEARILAEEAGILFYESALQGNRADEVNLAYLVRRGEIFAAPYPSLDTLLSSHLRENASFALINQALRLAKGVQCDIDWQLADILVGKIEAVDGVFKWWFARSEEGDSEGDLVTGWLARRKLARDPEKMPLARRMELAREGGWAVPEWMDRPSKLTGT